MDLIQAGAFVVMIIQRTGYNSLYDAAKVDSPVPNQKTLTAPKPTVSFVSHIATILFAFILLQFRKDRNKVYTLKFNKFFWLVGALYFLDDYLELDLSGLDIVTVNVLNQIKLIVTAIFLLVLMKKKQTVVQWCLLGAIFAMVVNFCITDRNHAELKDVIKKFDKGSKNTSFPILDPIALNKGYYTDFVGALLKSIFPFHPKAIFEIAEKNVGKSYAFLLFCGIVKVFISCIAAVTCEFSMKNETSHFLHQFIWIKIPQTICSFLFVLFNIGKLKDADGKDCTLGESFKANVSGLDYLPLILFIIFGYVLKAITTQFVLKLLDSVYKSLTEVISMGCFFCISYLFVSEKKPYFSPNAAAAVFSIIFCVMSYIFTKMEATQAQNNKIEAIEDVIVNNNVQDDKAAPWLLPK